MDFSPVLIMSSVHLAFLTYTHARFTVGLFLYGEATFSVSGHFSVQIPQTNISAVNLQHKQIYTLQAPICSVYPFCACVFYLVYLHSVSCCYSQLLGLLGFFLGNVLLLLAHLLQITYTSQTSGPLSKHAVLS